MLRTPLAIAAAALAALAFAAPAAAQTSGWYIGGGPGVTKADFTRSDFTGLATGYTTYTSEDDDVAPRVFGGYRVASNWAVEFGFAALGSYKHRYSAAGGAVVYDYDASALTAALAAHLPLGGGLAFNARGGIAFTAANLRVAAENGTVTANPPVCSKSWWYDDCVSTKTNLFWGVGAQFDINQRWGLRLDYDNYGELGEEFESGRADIEMLSLSVLYRF